nr:hypothetical protein [Paenibacillus bovis]
MRTAIVVGARQSLGFRICRQLLENGFVVYGKDFASWQNEQCEENWLYIGRNANLHFDYVEDEDDLLSDDVDFLIVPLIDFYKRYYSKINDQLLNQLQRIITKPSFSKTTVILVGPTAIHSRNCKISAEIEDLKINRKNVKEYCITMDNEQGDGAIYYKTSNIAHKWTKKELQNYDEIAQFLIEKIL